MDRTENLLAILREILQLYSCRSNTDQANYQEFLKLMHDAIMTMYCDGIETDYEKLERIEDEWENIFNIKQ